jgi:hypothetical protein
MSKTTLRSALTALLFVVSPAAAAVGEKALSSMPVREITVFKDGHAFVLHEGEVATDEAGNVHLDYLPTPVIGTFWPYSADAKVKLESVAAGRHRVKLERTALSIRELLEANIGSKIRIREARLVDGKPESAIYSCTILSIPKRSADELEASAPAGNGPRVAEAGQIILLKSEEGTRAVPIATIQDVTFLDNPKAQVAYEEIRNLLRLKLNWGDQKPKKTAKVGLTYLQRGIRWIPQYRLTLNDNGTVKVQLQATLLNELTDLKNVRANLLVGVPTFDFKDTVDPISLQRAVAELSQYFDTGTRMSNGFSNSIMTQQAVRMTERPRSNPQGNTVDLGPNVAGSGQNESMFMFTIRGVTLAKGERMVLPVGEWTMKYEDIYRLEVPIRPPAEVRRNFNTEQQRRIAELMRTPKAKHVIRITNSEKTPMTTAPALIVSEKGILGQGMMTYTAAGATVDIVVTTAVNVGVAHTENELQRTANARKFGGYNYDQIDMDGKIRVTNFKNEPIKVEVVRTTLGLVSEAGQDGRISRPRAWLADDVGQPVWWSWYSWPGWWHHMNSRSQVNWEFQLEAGKEIALPYKWSYFWRF